jgi:cysteine desulfurase
MPIVFGGGQERGLFPGTQSVADIVAIGKAAELALAELDENMISLRRMQQILMDKLLAVDGAQITGPRDPQKRLPGHLSLVLPGCRGEALVMRADLKGVCISSGSACHKGIVEPSQVLLACGVADTDALGSVRISAGRLNSVEECRKAADLLLSAFLACSRQASSRAPA